MLLTICVILIILFIIVLFSVKSTPHREIPFYEISGIDLYPIARRTLDSGNIHVVKHTTLPVGTYTPQEYSKLTKRS